MQKELLYSIIDVETTGGDPKRHRITEIAIIVFDGEKEVDRFSSLVNPEQAIPYEITRITGISNDMVKDAPKFYEVARQVVEMTEGTVFVGHNVRFDYSFVQKEYRRLGYTYSRKQLCTVKLSRKLLPGHRSYSLGKLCKALEIINERPHRAEADADATLKLFQRLLGHEQKAHLAQEIQLSKLPPNLPVHIIEELPGLVGVYYFYDQNGDILYVGKSNNIRKRVLSHFQSAHTSRRKMNMLNLIHDVSYTHTGSELIALLLENADIKKLQPTFNRAQRRTHYKVGIFSEVDADGYIRLKAEKLTGKNMHLAKAFFSGRESAEGALSRAMREYELCAKLCDVEKGKGRCFHYHLHLCRGACAGEEDGEPYNERVEQALFDLSYGRAKKGSFLIVGEGRGENERSVVWIDKGCYKGYAFMENDMLDHGTEEICSSIIYKEEIPDVQRIIQGYIKRNPKTVIPL